VAGYPTIEEAVGVIDGVNVTFYTPTVPYTADSVRVYINGQLEDDVYLTEIDRNTGEVELEFPPIPGDIVQLFYLDESGGPVCPERGRVYCPVVGTVSEVESLVGLIDDTQIVTGTLEEGPEITGELEPVDVTGVVSEVTEIRGRIEVCDAA